MREKTIQLEGPSGPKCVPESEVPYWVSRGFEAPGSSQESPKKAKKSKD